MLSSIIRRSFLSGSSGSGSGSGQSFLSSIANLAPPTKAQPLVRSLPRSRRALPAKATTVTHTTPVAVVDGKSAAPQPKPKRSVAAAAAPAKSTDSADSKTKSKSTAATATAATAAKPGEPSSSSSSSSLALTFPVEDRHADMRLDRFLTYSFQEFRNARHPAVVAYLQDQTKLAAAAAAASAAAGGGGDKNQHASTIKKDRLPVPPRSVLQKWFRKGSIIVYDIDIESTDADADAGAGGKQSQKKPKKITGSQIEGGYRMHSGQRVVIPGYTVRQWLTAATTEDSALASVALSNTVLTGPGGGGSNKNKKKPVADLTPVQIAQLHSWVLYRDEHILALNKPAGLSVQGGSSVGVTNHIDAMLPHLTFSDKARSEVPRLVHRLDKDVSGVLVLARTLKAAQALSLMFRYKTGDQYRLEKKYWALCVQPNPSAKAAAAAAAAAAGEEHAEDDGDETHSKEPPPLEGRIDVPLQKLALHGSGSGDAAGSGGGGGGREGVRVSTVVGSQLAVTLFKTLGQYPPPPPPTAVAAPSRSKKQKQQQQPAQKTQTPRHFGPRIRWLELQPLTGRKHQLRAHTALVLHTPILGDDKYPPASPVPPIISTSTPTKADADADADADGDVETESESESAEEGEGQTKQHKRSSQPGQPQAQLVRNRLHLHARSLTFYHPVLIGSSSSSSTTGKKNQHQSSPLKKLIHIEAPLPFHFQQSMRALGFDVPKSSIHKTSSSMVVAPVAPPVPAPPKVAAAATVAEDSSANDDGADAAGGTGAAAGTDKPKKSSSSSKKSSPKSTKSVNATAKATKTKSKAQPAATVAAVAMATATADDE